MEKPFDADWWRRPVESDADTPTPVLQPKKPEEDAATSVSGGAPERADPYPAPAVGRDLPAAPPVTRARPAASALSSGRPAMSVRAALRDTQLLRTGVLLSEVLDRPRALKPYAPPSRRRR